MYNEEIYKKLLKEFGKEKMATVTDVISVFYDIKYNAAKEIDSLCEYDYEKQWWANKHVEIVKQIDVNL
jgi:hypothetical protein